MHPFGGRQICARCDKTVYAAEQVMGPGRKLYHKPCLACSSCNKRLDSFTLLEHDQQPYCKNCHSKHFGTRDLRAANLPHRDPATPWHDPLPESPGRATNFPDTRWTSAESSPSPPARVTSPIERVASPIKSNGTGSTNGNESPKPNGFTMPKPSRLLSSPSASSLSSSPKLEPPDEAAETEAEEVAQAKADEESEERDTVTTDLPSSSSTASKRTSANGFPLPQPLTPTGTGSGSFTRGRFANIPRVPLNTTRSLSPTRSISPTRSFSPTRAGSASPTRALFSQDTGSGPKSPAALRAQSTGSTAPPSSLDRYTSASSAGLARSNSSVSASAYDKLANRPIHQTATGTRYGAALNPQNTGMGLGVVPGSPTKKQWGGTNPQCPRCGKSVYFAEQVRAVGRVYHKGCLRCMECGTSLDSNRLRDHDGMPYCVRCYTKVHGPQGSGYALLGKAGG